MKITTTDRRTFRLECETAEDEQFVFALDMVRHVAFTRSLTRPGAGGLREQIGAELLVAHDSAQALRADAGKTLLRAVGELFRLGLAEAADHGHVVGDAANPQTQEQLAAILIQVQHMLQTVSVQIRQRQLERGVGQGDSSSSESARVA
jgi:hypothetical protein